MVAVTRVEVFVVVAVVRVVVFVVVTVGGTYRSTVVFVVVVV